MKHLIPIIFVLILASCGKDSHEKMVSPTSEKITGNASDIIEVVQGDYKISSIADNVYATWQIQIKLKKTSNINGFNDDDNYIRCYLDLADESGAPNPDWNGFDIGNCEDSYSLRKKFNDFLNESEGSEEWFTFCYDIEKEKIPDDISKFNLRIDIDNIEYLGQEEDYENKDDNGDILGIGRMSMSDSEFQEYRKDIVEVFNYNNNNKNNFRKESKYIDDYSEGNLNLTYYYNNNDIVCLDYIYEDQEININREYHFKDDDLLFMYETIKENNNTSTERYYFSDNLLVRYINANSEHHYIVTDWYYDIERDIINELEKLTKMKFSPDNNSDYYYEDDFYNQELDDGSRVGVETDYNCSEVLDSYEDFVDDYIEYMRDAMNGDLTALTRAGSLMQKAESAGEKIQNLGEYELGSDCWDRYMKIYQKLTNAAIEMSNQVPNQMENMQEQLENLENFFPN